MAGTMRKVGKNKYRLEYMLNTERYSQNIIATTQSEASRKLAQFVAEIDKGNIVKQSDFLFVEASQLFLDKYAKSNLSPTTYRGYKNTLNKYILNEIGQKKANSITRLEVQILANKFVEAYNLSSKTTKNYIDIISAIYSKMIEWDLLNFNPAQKITIPKNTNKPKKKPVLYSYNEIEQFLNKLDKLENKELQLAIYTSFVTGARRGEVLGLSFDKFNFTNCTINLSNNTVAVNGGTQDKEIKNGKEREFYVPQSYIDKVQSYYNYLGKPSKDTKLFKMHPDTYSDKFKKFLKDNDLRIINLKDLRALNESVLVNKGQDIISVAKRLGHLPSTAMSHYLDKIPEEDKKASAIFENLL